MGSTNAEIAISRAADAVWEVVADFGGLAAWMPGVESCRLDGDERVLGIMGMEVRERLLQCDADARVLVYGISGGSVPVEHHKVTITVHPNGGGSRVTWDAEIEPDTLVAVMAPMYQQSLEALRARLEEA